MERGKTKEYPKIGVATIVLKNNLILIGFDGRKNCYSFPGGNWDGETNNESLEEAAARETFEETGGFSGIENNGVHCSNFKKLYDYTFLREDNQEWYQSVGFTADYESGIPGDDLTEERINWKFMEPEEILKLNLFEPAKKGLLFFLKQKEE